MPDMQKVIKGLLLMLLVVNSGVRAQTLADIDHFDAEYQKCSDKGIALRNCANEFYGQMDSILNVAYNKLRKQLPDKEKADLKLEELNWLKKRDQFIKEQKKEIQKTFESNEWDGEMYLALDHAAAVFVKGRTVELVKRLNRLKK